MKTPGLSLTLGMSQDTKRPYARVTGRHSGMVLGKSLDLDSSKGLIAALAGLLLVNAVKQSKANEGKPKRKPKKASVSLNAAQVVQGLIGKF
jgi:hypothetical protein